MQTLTRILAVSIAFATGFSAAPAGEEGFDWVKRKRQPFPGIDRAQAIAVDRSGGVLIAGDSSGRGAPWRARAVRLDPAGKEVWSWTGGDVSSSSPRCAGFDPEGNAYLAVTRGNGIEAVKFDRNGTRIWSATYSRAGFCLWGIGMAVDLDGRMAVAIHGGPRDFFTVLYDKEGNLVWTATYDGPASRDDWARAVAFDAAGNLYVTGKADGDHEDDQLPSTIATVKYDRSGAEVWSASHGGDGSSVLAGTDIAFAADGAVFVAAIREWPVRGFLAVKYGPGGDEMWAAAFDSPEAEDAVMALDPSSGDILVASGARVVRLTPEGVESWNATADGEVFRSVAVDRAGDIVAAGTAGILGASNIAAIKWSAGGQEVWSARIDGAGHGEDALTGMVLDGEGGVILAGSTATPEGDPDFLTMALAPTGAEVWRATSGTTRTTDDEARAVAIDPQGNIVAAGALAREFGTARYAPDGTELWAAVVGSGCHDEYDGAYALALDAAGDASVTGKWARNWLTIRYDREGNELWRAADHETGYGIASYPIVLDGAGNATAASFSLVIRYDGAGTPVWEGRYGGDEHIARAIALDREGNTLVAGGAFTWSVAVVVKYDGAGRKLWEAVYDRGYRGYSFKVEDSDSASAVAADLEGNIYMAGDTHADDHFEILTVKYDAQGHELWARTFSPAGHDAYAAALVLDGSSAVYVAGSAQLREDSSHSFAVLKYDPSGSLLWAGRVDPPPGWSGHPGAMCLDAGGNVHLAGGWWDLSNPIQPVIATFDPAGNLLAIRTLAGPGAFNAIAANVAGNICAAGFSAGDFVVAKYTGAAATRFRRGDSNADGTTDISDAVAILGFLFLGSTMNDCKDAADVNDDGKVDISDPVRLLGHLFLGSERPPDPFGTCGMDTTADGLDCNTISKCP